MSLKQLTEMILHYVIVPILMLISFQITQKKHVFVFFYEPDTVEDIAIRINPQHDVLHRCVVDKGALRVDKEHIRDPNLLY